MSLSDYIGSSLDGPLSAVRRQTIAVAVAAASAVGAVFYGLSAALLALEPLVGDISARLIVAAAFAAVAAAALLLPRLFHGESTRGEAEALARDGKIAMIVEAMMMGFALSSRGKNRQESRQDSD
jgi:hypothetical protein